MRRAALPIVLAAACTACAPRPASDFSTTNARAHVDVLARDIGPRPLGSPANARARAYLVEALRKAGFPDVRVRTSDARRPEAGLTARVSNIVAIKPGRRPEAIALVAHYDSVPESPGATDDAFGTAVAVEAGRVLAARPAAQYSLMVLVTDGEESGLLGAAAAAADRDIAYRIATYINIDSIGSSGPSLLFETGPGNGWLTGVWARAAPRPRGASFATDIYRRLPNDTDFSILKRTGAPGLNFAPIGDSYSYHTARDTAERLSDDTIRQTGENVVATARALDHRDLAPRNIDQPVYFDIVRTAAAAFGPLTSAIITLSALGAGLLGWYRAALTSVRIGGAGRVAFSALWTHAGSIAVFAAMTLAAIALRGSRETYHPWYAHPERLLLYLAAAGAIVGWGAARAGALLPQQWHGVRHPALVWTVALPIWILFAAAMALAAPLSAYLWTIPLGTAGVLLMFLPHSTAAIRSASAVVLAIVAVLWLDNLAALVMFTVPMFGRLPIVTPAWIYPTLLTLAGVMLGPPMVAIVIGRRRLLRPAGATAVALAAGAGTLAWAWMAPAYTAERPLRREARYVHDAASGRASLEVASLEPELDIGTGAPSGWAAVSDPPPASLPLPSLSFPFVYRGPADPNPAPASASLTFDEATMTMTLRITPSEPALDVTIVMPDGVRPIASNLPGLVRRGRWMARWAGLPAEGIAWTATLPAGRRAGGLKVVIVRHGLPGAAGGAVPAWLTSDRSVWKTWSVWIVDPAGLLR
ncbi:MAG TPA: M28 family peptidase [Vicinamibacterales bacterium]|nr:M28 family peptidase [Vicinamibacterales bacterium]